MSEILRKISADLKSAMKVEIGLRRTEETYGELFKTVVSQKTVCRAIISMIPEIGKKRSDATDDDIIKLLRKYISQEKERAIYQLGYLKEKDVAEKTAPEVKKLVSDTIREVGDELIVRTVMLAEIYLPEQASEEDIIAWIGQNLDLASYKNKMQAMGPIMKHFTGADGNFIKGILLKI